MSKETNRDKEQILRSSGVNVLKCMRCGKCSGTCPSYDEMEYHPHEFVYMVEKGEIEKLMASESVFKCLTCFACVERCPRGVEPAKVIEAVRLEMIRKQGQNHLKADRIPELLDDEMPAAGDCYRHEKICKVIERINDNAENRSICLSLRNQYSRYGGCKGCRGSAEKRAGRCIFYRIPVYVFRSRTEYHKKCYQR